MVIIIEIISFCLDYIISYILPSTKNNLSLSTPLIIPISIYLIYPLFKKNNNSYLNIVIVIGIIYDLIFTNLPINSLLFYIIGLISIYIYKQYNISKYSNILFIVFIIILYETINLIVLYLFNIIDFSFSNLIYKIIHTMITNVIYGIIIFEIINSNKKHTYYL